MGNFINPLLLGNTAELIDDNTSKVPAKYLAGAGISSLLVGAVLKKYGQNTAGNFIGSLALPLLAAACYKKFSKSNKKDHGSIEGDFPESYY